jgi:hypothetical protein
MMFTAVKRNTAILAIVCALSGVDACGKTKPKVPTCDAEKNLKLSEDQKECECEAEFSPIDASDIMKGCEKKEEPKTGVHGFMQKAKEHLTTPVGQVVSGAVANVAGDVLEKATGNKVAGMAVKVGAALAHGGVAAAASEDMDPKDRALEFAKAAAITGAGTAGMMGLQEAGKRLKNKFCKPDGQCDENSQGQLQQDESPENDAEQHQAQQQEQQVPTPDGA